MRPIRAERPRVARRHALDRSWILAAVLLLLPLSAAANDVYRIGVESAEIGWAPPAGTATIWGYIVSLSRNGAPPQVAAVVTEPRFTIQAKYGDNVVATVRALSLRPGTGLFQTSAPSLASPRFHFEPGRAWPSEGFLALHCEECATLELREIANTTPPEILPGRGAPWEVVGIADMHLGPGLEVLWYEPIAERIEVVGLGDTAARAVPNISMRGRTPIGLVDADGDGRQDVVMRDRVSGKVEIWKPIFGWLIRASVLTVPLSSVLVSGEDLDRDGTGDLWWQTPNGALEVWRLLAWNPQGVLVQRSNPGTTTLTHVGDFDGDAIPDALWRDANGVLQIHYLGSGASASVRTLGWRPGDELREVRAVANFNGAPGAEILVQHRDTLSVDLVHPTSALALRNRLIDMTEPWMLVDAKND